MYSNLDLDLDLDLDLCWDFHFPVTLFAFYKGVRIILYFMPLKNEILNFRLLMRYFN
jgi:hypothetical protein